MSIILIDITKRVSYDYFIKSKVEAGMVLFGWEVKCVRLYGINLNSSFVLIKNSNVFLIGSFIHCGNFIFKNDTVNESRKRKLLLNKKEIFNFFNFLKIKGQALIPSKVYWKNSFLKVEICLCIGKKNYDKRQALKEKEFNRSELII